jgi:hypothetical protein
MKNEFGETINLESLHRVLVNTKDLIDISVIKDGDATRPLTDSEKEGFEMLLGERKKGLPEQPENQTRNTLFALFMIFVYPILWILIAHFVFHF